MAKLPDYKYQKAPTAQEKAAEKNQRWLELLRGHVHLAREAAKRAK